MVDPHLLEHARHGLAQRTSARATEAGPFAHRASAVGADALGRHRHGHLPCPHDLPAAAAAEARAGRHLLAAVGTARASACGWPCRPDDLLAAGAAEPGTRRHLCPAQRAGGTSRTRRFGTRIRCRSGLSGWAIRVLAHDLSGDPRSHRRPSRTCHGGERLAGDGGVWPLAPGAGDEGAGLVRRVHEAHKGVCHPPAEICHRVPRATGVRGPRAPHILLALRRGVDEGSALPAEPRTLPER